ncbi:MAG: tetratricopeptide repeat-containing sensor histidine kinase [Bacteroidota bacterium]
MKLRLLLLAAFFCVYAGPWATCVWASPRQAPHTLREVDSLVQVADRLNFDHPDSAAVLFASALALLDTANYPKQYGDVLNKLGYTYYMLGEYDQSLPYFLSALKIHQSIGNAGGLSRSHASIGLIYESQQRFDESIRQLLLAVQYASKANDAERLTSSYFNLSIPYGRKGLYDSAYFFVNKALALAQKNSDHRIIAMAFNRIGEIAMGMKNFRMAEEFYTKALNYREYHSKWEKCFAYAGLAKVFLATNRYQESVHAGTQSLSLAKEMKAAWEAMQVSEVLAKAYSAMGKYAEAYTMHVLFKSYSDSVFNIRKDKEINRLYLKQNELEKTRLLKENELKEAEIRQRNAWIVVASLAACLLLSVAFLLYRNNRQKRRLNEMLVEQNLQLIRSKKQIELQNRELNKLNEAKSQVLSIVGHDMRGPIRNIAGVLQLANQQAITSEERNELLNKLQHAIGGVADTMDNLLAWAGEQLDVLHTNPRPFLVDDVVESQLSFCRLAAERKHIQLEHTRGGLVANADVDQMSTVLRNIIGNGIKFTQQGGRVSVSYKTRGPRVGICIADTGVGMDTLKMSRLFSFSGRPQTRGTANEKGTGLGLMVSREFVEKNQGEIEIQSHPGKGSTFTVWLPAGKL